MGCNDNIKHTCGKKSKAICTYYDGDIPEISSLSDVGDCVTLEETTEDLYALVEDLSTSLDLTTLGGLCLTYEEVDGEVTLIKVLEEFEKQICDIKESIGITDDGSGGTTTPNLNVDISQYDLDFKCLVDPCGTPIEDFETLLQLLIDKVCDCCTEEEVVEEKNIRRTI